MNGWIVSKNIVCYEGGGNCWSKDFLEGRGSYELGISIRDHQQEAFKPVGRDNLAEYVN